MSKNLPSNAGDVGSVPGLGTKIPHAVLSGQKIKTNKMNRRKKAFKKELLFSG